MKRGRTIAATVAVVLAVTGIAAGCGSSSSSSSSSSSGGGGGGNSLGLITPGTMVVGSDIPYPPFEQGSPPDYTGFDIDLIDAIAKKIGVTTQIQDTSFATIFSDQQAGKFDVVASSTTILPSREKKVAFSKPYFDANQSLMVQKGSPIKSTKDLTSSSTIAAQEGTTGQDYAEKHTPATVQKYSGIGTAFNALQAGQVDGVINDFAVSAFAQKKYPQLQVVQTIPTGEKYGFAMQKTNTKLQTAVNGALTSLINDGTYEKIFQKWFSGKPPKAYQPS
jgi:polar amino acid transport system substrate-binding protein